jgi:hypothetical protein
VIGAIVSRFVVAVRVAFVAPSGRQKEAYGRFLHNLAAACLIAATSIVFTENRYGVAHMAALLAIGVSCFVAGSVFSRGD